MNAKGHKFQWLLGGLIILVALAVGIAVVLTQQPRGNSAVTDQVIQTHYRQWHRDYLQGDDEKYVLTTSQGPDQTLSEAQGYGMLITALAARHGVATARQTFDQLTRYYLAHRLNKHTPLMAWRQTMTGQTMRSTAAEMTSATDGDLDIAYALIMADENWGSRGPLAYKALAQDLIRAIKRTEINPQTQLPLVGNWAQAAPNRHLVRPSDLSAAYFRRFAKYMQDGSWVQVALNSQTLLEKLSEQQATGLMADFVMVPKADLTPQRVTPNQVASLHDGQYGFNACRIPWRVAYDYQLSRSEVSRDVTQKLLTFFTKQSHITAVYRLDGRPVEAYANQAFSAPVAYAAQVMDHRVLTTRLITGLSGPLPSEDYYPATLQMLMLMMSGEIRNSD